MHCTRRSERARTRPRPRHRLRPGPVRPPDTRPLTQRSRICAAHPSGLRSRPTAPHRTPTGGGWRKGSPSCPRQARPRPRRAAAAEPRHRPAAAKAALIRRGTHSSSRQGHTATQDTLARPCQHSCNERCPVRPRREMAPRPKARRPRPPEEALHLMVISPSWGRCHHPPRSREGPEVSLHDLCRTGTRGKSVLPGTRGLSASGRRQPRQSPAAGQGSAHPGRKPAPRHGALACLRGGQAPAMSIPPGRC